MTVKVERAADVPDADSSSIARLIASEIKRNLMVSCTVDMIPYGTLRAPSGRRSGSSTTARLKRSDAVGAPLPYELRSLGYPRGSA